MSSSLNSTCRGPGCGGTEREFGIRGGTCHPGASAASSTSSKWPARPRKVGPPRRGPAAERSCGTGKKRHFRSGPESDRTELAYAEQVREQQERQLRRRAREP